MSKVHQRPPVRRTGPSSAGSSVAPAFRVAVLAARRCVDKWRRPASSPLRRCAFQLEGNPVPSPLKNLRRGVSQASLLSFGGLLADRPDIAREPLANFIKNDLLAYVRGTAHGTLLVNLDRLGDVVSA